MIKYEVVCKVVRWEDYNGGGEEQVEDTQCESVQSRGVRWEDYSAPGEEQVWYEMTGYEVVRWKDYGGGGEGQVENT